MRIPAARATDLRPNRPRATAGRRRLACALRLASALLAPSVPLLGAAGGPLPLRVVATEPAARSIGASIHTPIVLRFDRPVDPASVAPGLTLGAFGRSSGPVAFELGFAEGDRLVILDPLAALSAGEPVTVLLGRGIRGADGSALAAGFGLWFWTRARPAPLAFTEIDRLTTRTVPSQPTQAYGGIPTDLDGDGWLDVTVVNEITADLRVFPNRADGTGELAPFLQPTFAVGARASPSEPADFDRDGRPDIAVANIDDDSVSILLGHGDGTFGRQQRVVVGDAPRGIAVLDADGDGDVDVVNTNAASPAAANMTLLVNDGQGRFLAPQFFSAGIGSAWGLAAADMNEDGILDLVVGGHTSQTMSVLLGRGDGTFAQGPTRPAGGRVWMVVAGDLNGDRHDDVTTINSFDSSGSVLFGDGAGGLAPAVLYPADHFGLATDLGDLDGDGDLDWMTSSFNGNFRLNLNDGAGGFVFDQQFDPTSVSSCSLMLDLDRDGDLDLALIDEIADELTLMRNGGIDPAPPAPPVADGTGGGTLRVGKLDPGGPGLRLTWDATSCPAAEQHVLYGTPAGLPARPGGTYLPAGARCGVGTTQPFAWLEAPEAEGLLWFLVAGSDGAGLEGAWGPDGEGAERHGPGPGGASLVCGMRDKDPTPLCRP